MKQHMEALARANTVRLGRAQIKRDIHDGHTTVIDVLETKPFVCDTMTICELLQSQKRWGRKRTLKFLIRIEPTLTENRRLIHLTSRQNDAIVAALIHERNRQNV